MPTDLRDDLVDALWLVHLAVTAAWVHDDTPDARRTRDLVDAAAPLVARLVRLARLPVARGLAQDLLALARRVVPTPPHVLAQGEAGGGGTGAAERGLPHTADPASPVAPPRTVRAPGAVT
ncbi:hypothetical protein [Cellulomonas sp. JZ18]|uniref:hypothetical protein n=1 Tax=Cellulomonas sp. JZ18 TaxID=2654191 RepID=UPI001E2934B5|nr:hypothetical protein [Cellulomonas sp. JZ18]